MVDLDYEAHVPFADTKKAPFIIKVDPTKPPGDRFQDYISNETPRGSPPPKQEDRVHTRKVIVRGRDYVSREEGDKRLGREKKSIMALAKEVYNAESKRRRDFKRAQRLVQQATKAELEDPSPELARALKILSKKKPIGKREAMQQAKERFYKALDEK